MTRKEAKELMPIIKAFAEGKKIIVKDKRLSDEEYNWSEVDDCSFNIEQFEYRIKPEPTYRPFVNAEECWQEMMKHKPFGWLKSIRKQEKVHIGRVFEVKDYVLITLSINGILNNINNDSSYFFNEYTFADGTPFGIREEQQ